MKPAVPIYSTTNEGTGVNAEVFIVGDDRLNNVKYRVRVKDTDSGLLVPCMKDFDTEQSAINYANKCVIGH